MSEFALLPVIFYKNPNVFLDLFIFCKNVLLYFKKSCESVSTLKCAFKNVFYF